MKFRAAPKNVVCLNQDKEMASHSLDQEQTLHWITACPLFHTNLSLWMPKVIDLS